MSTRDTTVTATMAAANTNRCTDETTEATVIINLNATNQIINQQLLELQQQLQQHHQQLALVYEQVDAQVIAQVVADWTGIPVGRMHADQIKQVMNLQEKMAARVVGQDHALTKISQVVQTASAKLSDPSRPIAVFMLAGTSGVGKTETALTLAQLVYGSESNMTVINMSEFKEEHKVSLLLGSPPGYVGFGEGGVLTEAVRRKPYSVLLLDEMEKAHPGVQDIFFQVFDKGILKDGEGRDVDFKNCIIIMTSNVGTNTIMSLKRADRLPESEQLLELMRDELLAAFKPAFLGRIQVIPYLPLQDTQLASICTMQLQKIQQRMQEQHHIQLSYSDDIVDAIVARCTEVDSGARNIWQIINNRLLPQLAKQVLHNLLDDKQLTAIHLILKQQQFDLQCQYANGDDLQV